MWEEYERVSLCSSKVISMARRQLTIKLVVAAVDKEQSVGAARDAVDKDLRSAVLQAKSRQEARNKVSAYNLVFHRVCSVREIRTAVLSVLPI